MTNSNLTGDQLLGWSKKFSNLANDIPKEDKFNDIRNDLNKIADNFQVAAMTAFLDELDDAANKLQGVTEKIQNAINNIKQTDQILGQVANVVTAIGNLASAIGENNPKNIGVAIDKLLNSGGF